VWLLYLKNYILQFNFWGAATLTFVLENATGPATAVNYNQPDVSYMKGHASIIVYNANQTTNLSVFSVGRATAVNQALFRSDVTYDGHADVAFIAIQSGNGLFGGLRAANASFINTKGIAGVYAPGVQFSGPVFIGDINAFDDATPTIVIGGGAETKINGGDLLQTNGRPVTVAGLSRLQFVAGTDSHGILQAAQNNRARLEQGGVDVTAQVVVNP
jgi:hypothetical protein